MLFADMFAETKKKEGRVVLEKLLLVLFVLVVVFLLTDSPTLAWAKRM